MTQIADRYISKGGRTAGYGRKEIADDLLVAADFLVAAESEYFGGHTGAEAYLAMMRILDMDPIPLRKIIKGEEI